MTYAICLFIFVPWILVWFCYVIELRDGGRKTKKWEIVWRGKIGVDITLFVVVFAYS